MNTRTINKLRRKFIMISMMSLIVAMLFIGLMINIANHRTTIRLVHQVLNQIIDNDGEAVFKDKKDRDYFKQGGDFSLAFQPNYRQYQYYSCIYDSKGNITKLVDHLENQTEDKDLQSYADMALKSGDEFGRYGIYYYQIGKTKDGNELVVFVDSMMDISTMTRIFYWTLFICLAGLFITFALVWIFSKRMIQPEIENSKRQKEFITNASHELKTPLAVIRANVELEEMMNGETELSQSTLKQIDHMNGLIQNLVMIAKSEEKEEKSGMVKENVSKLVEESVEPFKSSAQKENIELVEEIEQNIELILDGSKIHQLIGILVDNAIKYCDENGRIRVSLTTVKKGKSANLIVSNSYAEGANVDYKRFFDRFYREDQSHNIDKGGYGIGLSIAESICKQNGGNIKVEWKNGDISFICKLVG